MKLNEMILVTENQKGIETKYLSSFEDYFGLLTQILGKDLADLSDAVNRLYQTKEGMSCLETYVTANRSFHAKFCSSEAELRGFLLGIHDEEQDKVVFSEDKCSKDCFEVLKTYGIKTNGHGSFNSLHYEAQEYRFKNGEVLHNLNGNDYLVLAVFSEKNLLLMSQRDGQYILADNTVMYERSPKEGSISEDSIIRGIEWGSGTYLGHDLTQIDLPGIIQEYGKAPEITTIEDFRREARRRFNVYQWLTKDEGIAFAVQWAAEESMRAEFGTTTLREFESNLQEGRYDLRMQAKQEERKEQSR